VFARVLQTPAAQALARRLEKGGVLCCRTVSEHAWPFFVALLKQMSPARPLLVVADCLKSQEAIAQDLETWLNLAAGQPGTLPDPAAPAPNPRGAPLFYPAWEVLPHEGRLPHADVISERLETLVTLLGGEQAGNRSSLVIVTNVCALLQRTFSPADLRQRTRRLTPGDRTDPLDLVEWLEAQGYEPEAQVTQKGEIAMRGGIVDVFPPTQPWPLRLEFFGDELESLREFDPLTQVSRGPIAHAILPPAGELGLLKRQLDAAPPQPSDRASAPAPPSSATSALPATATLLDYLPLDTVCVLLDPDRLTGRADEYAAAVPPGDPYHVTWTACLAELGRRGLTRIQLAEGDPAAESLNALSSTSPGDGPSPVAHDVALRLDSLDAWRPLADRPPEAAVVETQRREFFNQLHRWLRQGYDVHVFCNNDGERQRFDEIWTELVSGAGGRTGPVGPDQAAHQGLRPVTRLGTLSRGFLCDEAKLVVVTDAEIFGRYKVPRPRRLKSPHAAAMRSALEIDFTDLAVGDLVVHVQYGIGRYLGLKTLPLPGGPSDQSGQSPVETECLVLEYAPADPTREPPKLYVPVTEAHLVSKYVGAGKARPPLNVLGGTRWQKARARAEQAVRDVAAELLHLQAARAALPGHAFAPDTPWQREFEAAFLFEETPDQLQAIAETKADMERAQPMDRLICGDVGFGKTEVAIRAAFKAVMGGKQVAVLVPTTVLAQQHFNTFRERMADYPVRVELLSRFRTRQQQQRVLRDLAAGAVDIVIGTHRLLQGDVVFKDLGLVVIDEEQRFGVLHKERLKRLRTQVDVLTLSATPIPRTLYLALTGARDMSIIQTPPHDRLPVETIVTPYDERVIRDAILRELNRGGQVYYLHNRVLTIESVRARLQMLVPRARIVVGHGQMPSDTLEEVMTRFVNGEADVLLSTTIIESGLDIPNANTIIIDRADRFGLSDLYQLRGRVGRYRHQAYAYLLLPRHARLLTDVRRRLSAMRQYAALGSGFKIALRDLEIRGAGNLLGPEQSGHITAVGFELYCQLLKQSIAALKGEPLKPRADVAVRLDFLEVGQVHSAQSAGGNRPGAVTHRPRRRSVAGSPAPACLPHDYVPEAHQRIEMYRKLAQATDRAAIERVAAELRDRFGPPPPPVKRLLQLALLKCLAAERNVTSIEVQGDRLMLTRHGELVMMGSKFPRLTGRSAEARLREMERFLQAL